MKTAEVGMTVVGTMEEGSNLRMIDTLEYEEGGIGVVLRVWAPV